MKLHKECRIRVIAILKEAIKKVIVENDIFIKTSTLSDLFDVDKVLPNSGELISNYRNWIDSDYPLTYFIYDELRDLLSIKYVYNSEENEKGIISALEIDDVEAFCVGLIDKFERLPYSYKFFVELPTEFIDHLKKISGNVKISEEISIVILNDEFLTKSSISTEHLKTKDESKNLFPMIDSILAGKQTFLNKDFAYIEISVNGYISKLFESSTYEKIYDLMKYFLGLSLVLGVFSIDKGKTSTQNITGLFFIRDDVNYKKHSSSDISEDLNKILGSITYKPIFKRIEGEQFSLDALTSGLQRISKLFYNYVKAEKILLASRWYLDSFATKNELLSFIQTTVSIEILLGEKSISDIIGLGELLRNRCAYLLGNTNSERQKILEDFKEIYNIRSKIVHRGKPKLMGNERDMFYRLRNLCNRIIYKEINLLLNEKGQ